MKKFFTLLFVLVLVTVISPYSEAKKFGGGKSFGKSYNTAPAKKQSAQNSSSKNQQSSLSEKVKNNKGLIGGLLGGLIAGSLLSSLFGGGFGGFEGIKFTDILLLALFAFIAFKVFRMIRGMKPAPAANNEEYATAPIVNREATDNTQLKDQSAGVDELQQGSSNLQDYNQDVSFNLPPNFDMASCITEACDHYRVIQDAWNKNDIKKISEYVSPALLDNLTAERMKITGYTKTEVLYVDAEVVRADYNDKLAQISIKFFGSCKEVESNSEEVIDDIWHLERDLQLTNAPWLIVGIEA